MAGNMAVAVLTPGNCVQPRSLLLDNGVLKVADFSLARSLDWFAKLKEALIKGEANVF
jgi:hypothetical protein